jgi:hypothetical protein
MFTHNRPQSFVVEAIQLIKIIVYAPKHSTLPRDLRRDGCAVCVRMNQRQGKIPKTKSYVRSALPKQVAHLRLDEMARTTFVIAKFD